MSPSTTPCVASGLVLGLSQPLSAAVACRLGPRVRMNTLATVRHRGKVTRGPGSRAIRPGHGASSSSSQHRTTDALVPRTAHGRPGPRRNNLYQRQIRRATGRGNPAPKLLNRSTGLDYCSQEARLGLRPAQRHILRLMPERPLDAAWLKLGAEPGLCTACRHAKLNETLRGTAYLRCTRAAWDITLSRYPRLPVAQCGGFERREGKP